LLETPAVGAAASAQFVSNDPGIVMVAAPEAESGSAGDHHAHLRFAALLAQLLDHVRIDFGP
jgi:hypothetical protein